MRASSVRALGLIGAPAGRDTVVAALHDPVPTVRHMARDALRGLGGIDDSTPRQPGEPGIRRRSPAGSRSRSRSSRSAIPNNRPAPCCAATCATSWSSSCGRWATSSPAEGQATYAVGGVIKNLSVARGGADVEVICAVQLVVMRQPGNALFLMTSGEARVQKPKRQWRPQLQASMELEAVEGAVRGASADLISQLAR